MNENKQLNIQLNQDLLGITSEHEDKEEAEEQPVTLRFKKSGSISIPINKQKFDIQSLQINSYKDGHN